MRLNPINPVPPITMIFFQCFEFFFISFSRISYPLLYPCITNPEYLNANNFFDGLALQVPLFQCFVIFNVIKIFGSNTKTTINHPSSSFDFL